MAFINHFEGKETVIIAGRYDGTGTASITSGKGFSVVDGGTGTYTVTFHRAFDNLVAVTATALTSNLTMHVGTITHTDGTNGPSIVFQGNAIDEGADTDTDFSFITIWEIDT
tara:strand:- start:9826 stop:10161 length:336 start_codon:yes stop_codon:yes gene_type:complete